MQGIERTVDRQDITISPDLQVRQYLLGSGPLTLREATVEEYRELIEQGVEMGRLMAVAEQDDDGTPTGALLLADGFHRLEAMKRLGRNQVDVIVHVGTRDDGILLACELNAHRSLQYTSVDKHTVATRYLEALAQKLSGAPLPADVEIARRLGFSRRTIERARAEIAARYDLPDARQVTRGATTYVMEPRRSLLPPDYRDDLLDRNDEFARADLPNAGQVYRHRTSDLARSMPSSAPPLPPRRSRHQPAPDAEEAITIAVSWTYQDLQGQVQRGSTDLDHLDELPPVVRLRLLEQLGGRDWSMDIQQAMSMRIRWLRHRQGSSFIAPHSLPTLSPQASRPVLPGTAPCRAASDHPMVSSRAADSPRPPGCSTHCRA